MKTATRTSVVPSDETDASVNGSLCRQTLIGAAVGSQLALVALSLLGVADMGQVMAAPADSFACGLLFGAAAGGCLGAMVSLCVKSDE